MRYSIPVLLVFLLLSACSGENDPHEAYEPLPDTVNTTALPTFDISGPFEVGLLHGTTDNVYDNGILTCNIHDLQDDDTLWIKYIAANACEECRVETQLWRNDKYIDLVRDTGYGVTGYTRVPASLILKCSKFGTPEYEKLSFYLSVRQYHPVETGNKRFLFYLDVN